MRRSGPSAPDSPSTNSTAPGGSKTASVGASIPPSSPISVLSSFPECTTVELPYHGQWFSAGQPGEQRVLITAHTDAAEACAAAASEPAAAEGGPLERALRGILVTAAIDSACTGSLTHRPEWLVNTRPCSDGFRAADGSVSPATLIGDMPVIARDDSGRSFRFLFRNVRCVPDFKYTLLSVNQLWHEQRIDSLFADTQSLVLPASAGGRRVPYAKGTKLPTITFVSDAGAVAAAARSAAAKTVPAAKPSAAAPAAPAASVASVADANPDGDVLPLALFVEVLTALASDDGGTRALGFHRIGATSHLARLPAAQAAEVMHRRSHLGVDKLRATAHTTTDAPKVLASASASSRTTACASCAAARIRRAAHSGTLSAPAPEPGVLHIDLKELVLSLGGYRYVVFAIDEHSRFVFVEFVKHKSEVVAVAKRIVAAFEATVFTPVDEAGRALPRPRVREIHSDREGGLMSHAFAGFRGEASIHHTVSPPHDHDLNPIAERVIGLISETATAIKEATDAPARLWPWLISYAVDWHNSTITATGSSTAEAAISPHQRLTGKPPRVMDLAAFGCRAVVLKPPQTQHKPSLSARGWVGAFLGRSRNSKGAYDVLVGKSIVTSSSVTVDEEHFDWAPEAKRHQPLTPLSHVPPSPPVPTLLPRDAPSAAAPGRFLNLFSGPYGRADGLAAKLHVRGWQQVDQIDNDGERGGGWGHDLLNSSTYASLLAEARAGAFSAIMIAFPCSTGSVARLFDASSGGADRGPPPVRSSDHPDGLPADQLDPRHAHELHRANQLLDRVTELAIAARASPSRATIVFEQPADRSVRGSTAYAPDLAAHGSILATTSFKRLTAEAGLSGRATFAYCRLAPPPAQQKYTTLYYTPEAGTVLDALDGPDFQCNHEPGTHARAVGGRDPRGNFTSGDAAAYPTRLNEILADAFTIARTGGRAVPALPPSAPASATPPSASGWRGEPTPPVSSSSPVSPERDGGGVQQPPHAGEVHAGGVPPPSAVYGPPSVAASQQPSAVAPPRGSPRASPVVFPSLSPASSEAKPSAPSPPTRGELFPAISVPPVVGPQPHARAVRSHVRAANRGPISTAAGAAPLQRIVEEPPPATPSPAPQQLFSPGGTADAASYVPFTAPTPDAASTMEAAIASCILAAASEARPSDEALTSDLVPISSWREVTKARRVPRGGKPTRLPGGSRAVVVEVLLADGESLTASAVGELHDALRADSPGAPATHAKAVEAGTIWIKAEHNELGNHKRNGSWTTINRSEVPHGRRIHKLIWVYKLKRDGTAKARLCVQGSSLEAGIDYDQVWSSALRYSSARALFAYAAHRGCRVRSVDLVAAYLQGSFVDGEVVFCNLPSGYVEYDAKGQPLVARVEKPIYGIQQAGRRLQRMLFAWVLSQGFRQLDDSDPCVFVRECPGGEVLTVGIYVDNLQIVHSAELGADGRGPKGCAYNEFMDALTAEWDVTDEGPMEDLLGIEVDYLADGAIKLHQESYVKKIVERFLPDGPSPKCQCGSLPYSPDFLQHMADAFVHTDAYLLPRQITSVQ